MELTNILKLPAPLVAALVAAEQPPVCPSTGTMRVTALTSPPRLHQLLCRHYDSLTDDASNRIWALFGTAVHKCAQLGQQPDTFSEVALEATICGIRITGTMDLYTSDHGGTVWDYKTGSVGMLPFVPDPKWVEQLNFYAELAARNLMPVNQLRNILLMRDWVKAKARRDYSYPRVQVQTLHVPLWPQAQREQVITTRLQQHLAAVGKPDNKLPPCTQEEYWGRDEAVALYLGEQATKTGKCKATKLFKVKSSLKAAALAALKEAVAKGATMYRLGYRPATRVRCEDWCPVAHLCSQYEEAKKPLGKYITVKAGGQELVLTNEGRA